MDHRFGIRYAGERHIRMMIAQHNHRFAVVPFGIAGRIGNIADVAEAVSFAKEHGAELGLAEPRRVRQHCIEHGLEVPGRTRNDAQHLGSCGLLFERFAQFVGALLDLLFQAGIGFLQLARHVVELVGERLELVPGLDRDALGEIAAADARRAGL